MNSTVSTPANITPDTFANMIGEGICPKPFYLGQIVKADLDVGQMSDGQEIGYPCPGLKIKGIGYHEFFWPETGSHCQDLAGIVVRLPDWGFKSQIQFRVAYEVAHSYGHQWAQPTWVTARKPQPNGAVKLVEEAVKPSNVWDAAMAANIRLAEEIKRGWQDAQYTAPTPSWVSGSSTYKVDITPSGEYTIIMNGIVEFRLNPDGHLLAFKLVPSWQSSWTGRANNLREAMLGVINYQHWVAEHPLVELFESDKNFWKTGFVAGTRWYE